MISRLCTYLLFAGLLAGAGRVDAAEEPVRLTADQVSYDQEEALLLAEGNVQATWGGATLTARRIAYLRDRDLLDASGDVLLTKDGDWFRGNAASFEVATDRGTIDQPRLFLKKPNLHLAGSRMERESAVDYRVQGGELTTCEGDDPSWRIRASEIDVTLEEYASARNAVFYIARVPVFYFPYLLFPVNIERQSGLLLPTIGNSTKKGFAYSQPYYWAISPSADATFAFELQTRRGVGGSAEFRYLRPNQGSGRLNGFAIAGGEQGRTRGHLRLEQREELPAGFTLRSDLTQVTDRDYYRDFTLESGDYNRDVLASSLQLGWQGEGALLGIGARTWRNLNQDSTDVTLQRLPELQGRLVSTPIGRLPLTFGVSGAATRFERRVGAEGVRAEVTPMLRLAAPLVPGVTLTAGGGYQLRGYLPEGSSQGDMARGLGIALADGGIETTLERTFGTGWSTMPRVRHWLVPGVGYRYAQERNQGQLPFYDWDDRVPAQQGVNWSLANVVQGEIVGNDGSVSWRDLLEMRLSQGLLLTGERRDLLAPADAGDRSGDLRLEVRTSPVKELFIWLDSRYNPNRGRVSSTALAADYRDLRDNAVGISYFSAHDRFSYLEGRLATSLLQPVTTEYRARYSFDRPGFLESYYSLEYRHQCWGIAVSYRDRPDNREVMVSFSLGGLGSLGKLKVF